MSQPSPRVLLLDAMGVIYRVGDDVADLLIPFIRENGGLDDVLQIEEAYIDASLGNIKASEFWRRVNVPSEFEDRYLRRLELSNGVSDLLDVAGKHFREVACLSNDVSEWSRKLRIRFGLDRHISRWYISGDLGCRKPSPEIYRHMLDHLKVAPADILFVDDRPKNLHAAAELGIQTVYFDPENIGNSGGHRSVASLSKLV
jgi:FMN phosphatase YigB (HAD superfamily)